MRKRPISHGFQCLLNMDNCYGKKHTQGASNLPRMPTMNELLFMGTCELASIENLVSKLKPSTPYEKQSMTAESLKQTHCHSSLNLPNLFSSDEELPTPIPSCRSGSVQTGFSENGTSLFLSDLDDHSSFSDAFRLTSDCGGQSNAMDDDSVPAITNTLYNSNMSMIPVCDNSSYSTNNNDNNINTNRNNPSNLNNGTNNNNINGNSMRLEEAFEFVARITRAAKRGSRDSTSDENLPDLTPLPPLFEPTTTPNEIGLTPTHAQQQQQQQQQCTSSRSRSSQRRTANSSPRAHLNSRRVPV